MNLIMCMLESMVLCYIIFQFHSSMKRSIHRQRGAYIAAWVTSVLVCTAVMMAGSDMRLFLSLWLTAVLTGWLLYERTAWQLVHATLLLITMAVLLLFINLMVTAIFHFLPVTHMNPGLYWVVFIVMKDSILVVAARGFITIAAKRVRHADKQKTWIISLLFLVLSLVFMTVFLNMTSVYLVLYGEGIILAVVLFIMLLFANVFLHDIINVFQNNKKLEAELKVYQQQAELQYQYYQSLEEKYQSSRKLIHDIRNHLHAVESLYHMKENDAGSRYTKDIHGKLNLLGQQYYCDNRILNIILNDKCEQARTQGTELHLQIKEVHLDQIKDIDITTIFANLLDNAVQAAADVEQGAQISFRLEQFHDLLVIHIRNSRRIKNNYENRHRREGIGLKNVKSVLDRYNGTMEIKKGPDWFQVHIVIPLEEKV